MTSHDISMIEAAKANAHLGADRRGLAGTAREEFVVNYVEGALRAYDRLGEVARHPAYDGPLANKFYRAAFEDMDAPIDEIAKAVGFEVAA